MSGSQTGRSVQEEFSDEQETTLGWPIITAPREAEVALATARTFYEGSRTRRTSSRYSFAWAPGDRRRARTTSSVEAASVPTPLSSQEARRS
jgi:hypothetical protein